MRSKVCLWAARGLLLFLFAVNCYRAATQSITADEAFTYNESVAVPIEQLWRYYEANDHVFHTLLCKLSVGLFGLSEFTLRVPSLLGGLLLFWTLYRLSRLLFGAGPAMLLAVSLVALNPFVLDYCSIARGYGMATALLLFSLYQLLRQLESPQRPWRLYMAGIGLALGVAANLTVAVPGLILVAAFASLYIAQPVMTRNWPRVKARMESLLDHLVVPGTVLAVLLLAIPLATARRAAFYIGEPTLASSSLGIVQAMLWRGGNFQEATHYHQTVRFELSKLWAWGFAPIVLFGSGVMATWRRRPLVLVWLVTIGTLLLLAALHSWFGILWPVRRTGLYFVPLFTLLAVIFFEAGGRWLRLAGLAIAVFALSEFLSNWNTTYYDQWRNEAGNKEVIQYLSRHAPREGVLKVVVSPGYYFQSIRFYQTMDHAKWLATRNADSGDCFVLLDEAQNIIGREKLKVIWRPRRGGVTIAGRQGCPLNGN